MSGFTVPPEPVDANGQATHQHIAGHHLGNGEVTLCGLYVDYATSRGTAPGAPACERCEQLDC